MSLGTCQMIKYKRQQGVTLIVVLLLLLLMIIMAIAIASNSGTHTQITMANVLRSQASQAARSGSDALLSMFLKDGSEVDKLQTKSCNLKFDQQYTANGNNKLTATGDDKRKINLYWFACYPEGGKVLTCNSGKSECFSVIIAGVACPAGITTANDPSCVVNRQLQGYRKSKAQ